jgi:hypothetical protein
LAKLKSGKRKAKAKSWSAKRRKVSSKSILNAKQGHDTHLGIP